MIFLTTMFTKITLNSPFAARHLSENYRITELANISISFIALFCRKVNSTCDLWFTSNPSVGALNCIMGAGIYKTKQPYRPR